MKENWERIQSLFLEALDLSPEERAPFLDTACADDAELRREVESLIAHESSGEQISMAIGGATYSLFESAVIKPGTRVGDYEVVKLIGSGGMGEVYQARDILLARDVAIKVLPPLLTHDPDRLRRFEQEARAAAALNHPNIVAMYQMGVYQGAPYLVSELLEGSTLHEQMKPGPLPPRKAIEYAAQIARGLGAAHAKGITHRDLKPENLFVTNDGHVKILDFGLAKFSSPAAVSHGRPVTEAGLVMGTVGYMSPEQVRGQAVDFRTDFFAFGAILYEMLCGQPAFTKATAAETISAILSEDPPGISQLLPTAPPALWRVVHRCVEKNPEQRFQSASDLAFALEALSDPGLVAVPGSRAAWRRGTWKVALPLVMMALLVVSGVYYRAHQKPRLTEKDTTVLADFANTTQDPVFDDTLKTGLTVSLSQSPFLNVLSDSKVVATLQLMARSTTTSLTPDVAREVCQRVGSRALIAGSIASLGSAYVLALKAMNCQSGDLLAEVQVTAPAKEKVLDALGEAASKLRAQLGESLVTVQNFDVPLAEATTSSLDALKAFSLGEKTSGEKGPADGLSYFLHAVELDPNFAMGYSSVGDNYNSLGEVGRASAYYAKAFELRQHASEREKLTITANYYLNVTGELEKAALAYQHLIGSYPRDSRSYNELGNVLTGQGQYENAADAYRQSMLLDPNSSVAYGNLGNAYMALQRFEDVRHIFRDAQARKLDAYILHTQIYTLAFLGTDAARMREEQNWFTGKPEENVGLSLASDTEAYTGHLRKARELTRQSVDSAIRADSKETGAIWLENAALREAAVGNAQESKQVGAAGWKLFPTSQGVEVEAALASAMAGDAARAEFLAQELTKRYPTDTQMQALWLPTVRAQVALDRKDPTAALEYLRVAAAPIEFGQLGFTNNLSCLYPTYIHGQAYLATGQGSAAAAEFQKILDHSGIVWNCSTGALAHLGMARSNALQVRTLRGPAADAARMRARTAYRDFFTLWKDADPDVPILREAKVEYAELQ